MNSTYSGTLGGPIVKNHAWFFVAYEDGRRTTPETQLNARPGISPESFQQVRKDTALNLRGTVQLSSAQNVWMKVVRTPSTGIVRSDYWGNPYSAAEREALTAQVQGGTTVSAQYTAVISNRLTAEAMVSRATEPIDVIPFERHHARQRCAVHRPQRQPCLQRRHVRRLREAAADAGDRRAQLLHDAGREHPCVQVRSRLAGRSTRRTRFSIPNNQIFYGIGFDPVARRTSRRTIPARTTTPGLPHRTGNQLAIYARDKFQLGRRLSVEAGLRVERQTGKSDVGVPTVDTTTRRPAALCELCAHARWQDAGSSDHTARYYDGVLQGFSDCFANVPQQENYKTFVWNGCAYVFSAGRKPRARTTSCPIRT